MIPGDITGIVLSGGRSSRMGQDKSLMIFKGKPLISHAVDILKPLCANVVISSNRADYDFTGCMVWPDELPVNASMIGVYSCLKRSQTEWNMILSCDMPLVDTRLFEFLHGQSQGYETVIPVHHDGCMEPLCGMFNRSVLPGLELKVKSGQYGMQKFIESTRCRLAVIDARLDFFHERMFSNLNEPCDFDNLFPDAT